MRTSSYSHEEDLHLCHVYLDIFGSPAGMESKGEFWSRVDIEYNNTKPNSIAQCRPKRSLQSRMSVILTAVQKMKGCIQQVENLQLSGASEQDVFFRAKMLFREDENFKKGFKFDHVWPLLKDIEKLGSGINRRAAFFQGQNCDNVSSHSESPPSKDDTSSRSTSHGLTSFSHDVNEEKVDGTSTQRLTKQKRKHDANSTKIIEAIREENRQLAEFFGKEYQDRQQAYQMQKIQAQYELKKLAMAEYREDNKILLKDLNSITDVNLRELFQSEQARIIRKRAQQQGQGSDSNFGSFVESFDDLSGPKKCST